MWQPGSNALMATLVAPACPQTSSATQLAFLADGPYLVSVHQGKGACICVWNLLTLAMWWCAHATVHDVAAHPAAPLFTAVLDAPGADSSAVATFGLGGPAPVETWRSAEGTKVARAFSVPLRCKLHSQLSSTDAKQPEAISICGPLLLMTEDRRLILVLAGDTSNAGGKQAVHESGTEGEQGAVDATVHLRVTAKRSAQDQSGFEALYGQQPHAAGQSEAQQQATVGTRAAVPSAEVAGVFDAPSHLLPPAEELADSMLRLLLRRK